jgi:hypothetical protein
MISRDYETSLHLYHTLDMTLISSKMSKHRSSIITISPKTLNEKPMRNGGRNGRIPEAMEEIHVGNDPTEPI